ncbi:MAG TPA: 5-(carboxyamino)imidazole ribonucleotide synthase [Allosphingosinicella sp.]|nr:5-(carboxyamino)imidazole ribonucleotide synthase [Allosphingosinicella sp.]
MSLKPGSTIGIVGGGQLGRMLAMAAARLGYRVRIYAPENDSVAGEVAAARDVGDYFRSDLFSAFAEACDVVTYEFENVPSGPLALIEPKVPLHPPVRAIEIAQDRVAEKGFVRGLGGRTAAFAIVNDRSELSGALSAVGLPAILKTIRFGYDGKGQARVEREEDAGRAWHFIRRKPAIAEELVRFEREYSVILVRGADGEIRFWDSCENRHSAGILAETRVPAHPDILAQEEEARALARRVAEELGYVGVLTLEYFATKDGPLFNEMAPRVHNSGHWTIEGAITSQFENHIRAICGLPLGSTALAAREVRMENLIGDDAARWREILADPAAHLHLYGKSAPRPGRKMGHVTWLIR